MNNHPVIEKPTRAFSLVELISSLAPIELELLDQIEKEIAEHVKDWQQPYPEYASSGLEVAVLMSPDGREDNFSWDDCDSPQETPLLAKMPALKQLLNSFNLNIMASRLLKLNPGTFLHEHRDFVYLKQVERFRLHIPVVTNSNAFIVTPGKRVHLERGYLWRLDPKNTIHSACNFGDEPRLHIMIDCYMNGALKALIERASLKKELVVEMPRVEENEWQASLAEAENLLSQCGEIAAEEHLLKKFCEFDLEERTTYDLLFQFYRDKPVKAERLKYWQDRVKEVYPQ